MPARRRRAVGWALLLSVAMVVAGGGWLSYRAVRAILLHQPVPHLARAHTKCTFTVTEKNPTRRVNYEKDFKDKNETHLAAAKQLGIAPQATREDFEVMVQQGKLVPIGETQYYTIDRLTHSAPYLVPEAADFLIALGKLMQEYDGTPSRFVITSVLRSEADVKSLTRRNSNASKNSCHRYGTTIDIAYHRFDRWGSTTDGRLKENLARALYDLRAAGHCYVVYERKQACFHITVRPQR